jgi:hypothetical protein
MGVNNFTPLQDLKQNNGFFSSSDQSKETEPLYHEGDMPEKLIMHEASEYNIDEEAAKFIEKRGKTVDINEDLRKIGVIPVETNDGSSNFKQVHLPITDDSVVAGLKQPITSSFRWLAEFALYLLRKAHMILKKVHGKIVRVVTG